MSRHDTNTPFTALGSWTNLADVFSGITRRPGHFRRIHDLIAAIGTDIDLWN